MFDPLSCNRRLSANKDAQARHDATYAAKVVKQKREGNVLAESAAVDAAAEKEKEQHEERQAVHCSLYSTTSYESMEDAARDDVNKQRCAADHALLFYATISTF